MADQEIRLRLVIRRHGVPEVKLVWPCSRSSAITIATLMSSVNEVMPLESSQWGLEDYVVEIPDGHGGAYECLHFQLVAQILKDDDQVIIRSLLKDDLRRRRLTGRHQISRDGTHLVDGVAFGRPWLRAPRDRPALELPPRKRARIGTDEMEMPEPQQLLMLEAPPDNDEDDEEWTEEMEEVHNSDSSESGQDDEILCDGSDNAEEQSKRIQEELDEEARALLDPDDGVIDPYADPNECSMEHVAAIRTAYPLLSFTTIEKELSRQKQNLRKTYDALQQSTAPSLSFDVMMDQMVMGILEQNESSPVREQPVDIFNQQPPSNKPLIEEVLSEADSGPNTDSDSSTSNSSSSDASSSADEPSDIEESDDDDSSFHGVGSTDDTSDESSDDSSDDSSSESSEASEPGAVKAPTGIKIQEERAPQQGLTKTQKRNARRRKQKATNQQNMSTPDLRDVEFLTRKEALLSALQDEAASNVQVQQHAVTGEVTETTPGQTEQGTSSTPAESVSRRRARVDMGAGRRMLFGALGLKNPKSKADEERLKQGLMKDINPLPNPRIVEVADGTVIPAEEDADPNAWRSKVTYRAVECCQNGMVLSEPPFPFIQRWDPQQQYGSMRKRKRQSGEHNTDDYIRSPSNGETPVVRNPFGSVLNGTAQEGHKPEDAVVSEVNGDAHDLEDLPELPEDLTSLPSLEKGAARAGMIVTWKQCIMSKATQWQPVIASLTGEVLLNSSESSLEVILAFRDRENTEKLYDEKTGQRIYDKFETPDFEDEADESDDGFRTVAWEEMMEPRVLADTSPWAVADRKALS
ncbi:hypothetical protein QQS21_005487 [Conoideocrella luteorostrata]|uniref:DUF7357 domain-containing protein n=1 Tax=Conoideocrella luteorostrata TaxID=1105319 RepID=A0AAJ0CS38_9HYPO|nr:hypothetical protein QQS21_005487 [Conoideocrella luteorostrata]